LVDKTSEQFYGNRFLFLVLIAFILINTGYYFCLHLTFQLSAIAYAWLLEFLAFGFAYDTAVIVFSLFASKNQLLPFRKLQSYPPVALVCCTCDDVDLDTLRKLTNQTYPNLDTFILDDSEDFESKLAVNSLNLRVVRRANRAGYKAGNLNNWLFRYGFNYSYFVVADADSIFPEDFVQDMAGYAENPENETIAVFESIIHSWNVDTKFVRLLTLFTPLVDRFKLHVDNPCGSTLSVGHNNLYRTRAIFENGGFNEKFIAEDYATTIDVLGSGIWRCKTAPVVSFERVPSNLREYARRQARWAFQTLQLGSLNISYLSFTVRLKIIRSLSYYLESILIPIGIALMIWSIARSSSQASSGLAINEYPLFVKIILFWVFYFFVPLLIRLILAVREGASVINYVKSTLLHGALFVATIWPIVKRLIRIPKKRQIGFDVTGRSLSPSFVETLKIGGPGFILFWLALLLVLLNPVYVGLNLIWILPSAMAPFIIHHCQKVE
jgi:cellulose synthase/poly-beta-1,6-N-acetylglucosamine synthase-like glycosyltransferase